MTPNNYMNYAEDGASWVPACLPVCLPACLPVCLALKSGKERSMHAHVMRERERERMQYYFILRCDCVCADLPQTPELEWLLLSHNCALYSVVFKLPYPVYLNYTHIISEWYAFVSVNLHGCGKLMRPGCLPSLWLSMGICCHFLYLTLMALCL